ncbi:MAG: PAS domain S-box protein [Rubrivivax sp.]|nr:PAS domain S-box protein [Rubrivivax sp.]
MTRPPVPAAAGSLPGERRRRMLLWGALVGLLVVAQSLLVWLTVAYEHSRALEQVDMLGVEVGGDVKRNIGRAVQDLQALTWTDETEALPWAGRARAQLQARKELARLEWRDPALGIVEAVDSLYGQPLFERWPRSQMSQETELACKEAERGQSPRFSASYFVPQVEGRGQEVIDLCLPRQSKGRPAGFVVATFVLGAVLEAALPAGQAQRHEFSFIESDGARLARAGASRGAGVYQAERLIDLPGRSLLLRVDSAAGRPSLIPNLTLALVLGLSIALTAVVVLLARDVRRRATAEEALAEALAFRKAMEDSLITGLRARDLQGRITYVNPAFCAMVGLDAQALRQANTPPYWPPEQAATYAQRQATRLAQTADQASAVSREGFETVFMRSNGERFPVMIYEAPLVDGQGRHTGWMSAVLDVSQQQRMEELSRQQQERLQASARLATMGEMASLLSHELNQPLSAIASYAAGSLNLVADGSDPQTPDLLRQALGRIAEQAERAGRVIKSVHDFVRRRDQQHEAIAVDRLIDAVMPLIRLQARKCGARIELDLAPRLPAVRCDRTMVEQVLLNLARNGIQAMESVPLERRVLRLRAQREDDRRVALSVEDAGVGIDAGVAARIFTPFFTTRSEGMGLGLSLCRTVIEQHGGALQFQSPWPADSIGGSCFRFSLPLAGDVRAKTPQNATSLPPV